MGIGAGLAAAGISAAINGAISGAIGSGGIATGGGNSDGSTGGGGVDWSAVGQGAASSGISAFINDWFGDANAKSQFNRNLQLMEQQGAINEDMYRKRYQMTVEDMKKAGLNPILAATGGFSVGSGPDVSLPSQAMAPAPGVPSIASSAREFGDLKRLEAETSVKREEKQRVINEAMKTANEAIESIERARLNRAQQNLVTTQEAKTAEEVVKVLKEIQFMSTHMVKMEAEMDELVSRMALQKQETLNLSSERENIRENKNLILNKIKQIQLLLPELEKTADVYTGAGGSVIKYTKEILSALGVIPAALGFGIGRLRRPSGPSDDGAWHFGR